MPELHEYLKQEDNTMGKNIQEKELLIQIAKILLNENIIMPEEQIRFLEILKGEA